MDRERSVGMAYWGSIEYWGESNRWPKKGWNYSFFSHTLQPYPQAWLIRSAFKPQEPLVHIGVVDESGSENVSWNDVNVGRTLMTESWNHPEGSSQTVVTYTNAPSVELLANGKSLGIKQNDGIGGNRNMIQWQDVDYGKGGTLLAIARDEQGREMTRHQIETAGRAVRLVITPETSDWHADGQDLLYLNIMAVDVKGRIVPTFKDSLAITVEGPGTLLALDNGDHYTNDIFVNVSTMPMREGRMLAILRSGHETGRVKVTAKTIGMKSQKFINVE
jgi:beta-galactosidase